MNFAKAIRVEWPYTVSVKFLFVVIMLMFVRVVIYVYEPPRPHQISVGSNQSWVIIFPYKFDPIFVVIRLLVGKIQLCPCTRAIARC
jgi:hypothetical protein